MRDRDGLYYDTEYPVLSNLQRYPTSSWKELDAVREALETRKNIYRLVTEWRRSERYREIGVSS